MLDNDNRVAFIDQFIQYIHQDADILKVQSGSRFVKNIERLARIPFGEFGGQLHTLALATGERGGRLPQLDIPQADLLNYLNLVQYLRYVSKNSTARFIVISSTSAMDFPLKRTSSVSRL